MPLAFRASPLQRISGSESGFPVVARFTNVTYEVAGDDLKTAGAPSAGPGLIETSTMLSFTTIGDMTTPVPSSRAPSRKRLISTMTWPRIFLICLSAICCANPRMTSRGSPGTARVFGSPSYEWSSFSKDSVPSALTRPERFGSPLATRIRSPSSVPSALIAPVRYTRV